MCFSFIFFFFFFFFFFYFFFLVLVVMTLEGCSIDKLVALIASVKGEHGKVSKELEDEEQRVRK